MYALAPCGRPAARFVADETGPAAAPSPRAVDHVRQTLVGPHDSGGTGQADPDTPSHRMRTLLHLNPGQKGTKHLLAQYGDRLLCVRYRDDTPRQTRFKTVELIVAQREWAPPAPRLVDDARVAVRVGLAEVELRRPVKQGGGRWNPRRQGWELRYAQVVALKLEPRLVEEEASDTRYRGKAESIYLWMPRRSLHVDACIQYWMPASSARCQRLQSNSS